MVPTPKRCHSIWRSLNASEYLLPKSSDTQISLRASHKNLLATQKPESRCARHWPRGMRLHVSVYKIVYITVLKTTTQQAPLDQHHGINRTLLQTDNRQCFVNLVYIIQKNKTPALLVKTAIDPAYFCLWETFVNNSHFILEISVMLRARHGFLNLWWSKAISFSPSRFYRYIIPYAFINSDWLICCLIIVSKLIYPTVIQMLLLCKESGYG